MANRPCDETEARYHLHLFVAGDEPNSRRARENLERICAEHIADECRIEETDVFSEFQTALEMGVYVTPALIVSRPEQTVTVFGNLSDTRKVLEALGLEERNDERREALIPGA
ncbi:MAG: circadian clock KaiB family protein [Armatimonadota bacterium]